jgi:hypothetical protein
MPAYVNANPTTGFLTALLTMAMVNFIGTPFLHNLKYRHDDRYGEESSQPE